LLLEEWQDHGEIVVVPGSRTGDLSGLRGEGGFEGYLWQWVTRNAAFPDPPALRPFSGPAISPSVAKLQGAETSNFEADGTLAGSRDIGTDLTAALN
jgi:hypothetical protein